MAVDEDVMAIPKILYHKVLGGYVVASEMRIRGAVKSIMSGGLLPKKAEEYRLLVPREIRESKIVWLSENYHDLGKENYFQRVVIETKYLDPVCLYKVESDDVKWWVYKGPITSNAITLM